MPRQADHAHGERRLRARCHLVRASGRCARPSDCGRRHRCQPAPLPALCPACRRCRLAHADARLPGHWPVATEQSACVTHGLLRLGPPRPGRGGGADAQWSAPAVRHRSLLRRPCLRCAPRAGAGRGLRDLRDRCRLAWLDAAPGAAAGAGPVARRGPDPDPLQWLPELEPAWHGRGPAAGLLPPVEAVVPVAAELPRRRPCRQHGSSLRAHPGTGAGSQCHRRSLVAAALSRRDHGRLRQCRIGNAGPCSGELGHGRYRPPRLLPPRCLTTLELCARLV